MKKPKYPAAVAIIKLLEELVKEDFSHNSLELNKKLLTDLKDLQGIIFDKSQRYGNPNYYPKVIESELSTLQELLNKEILKQLSKKTFPDNVTAEQVFIDLKYAHDLDHPWELQEKAVEHLVKIIFSKIKKTKSHRNLLYKVKEYFNHSDEIYKKIDQMLLQ